MRQGNSFISGNLSFYQDNDNLETQYESGSNNSSENERLSFNANVEFGHFVADNFAVGVGASFYFQSSSTSFTQQNTGLTSSPLSEFTNETQDLSLTLNILARHYVPISRDFAYFTHFRIGYGQGETFSVITQTVNEYEEKSNGTYYITSAFINAGLAYFINQSISIDLRFGTLGYSIHELRRENKGNGNSLNLEGRSERLLFDLSLSSINLGLSVFF
jgi:hypothetical protein